MKLSHRPASHEGASQKGLLGNPRGCSGAVMRVLWTIHDNLMNDGKIRVTGLLRCQLSIIAKRKKVNCLIIKRLTF